MESFRCARNKQRRKGRRHTSTSRTSLSVACAWKAFHNEFLTTRPVFITFSIKSTTNKTEQISSKILQQQGEYVQLLFSQPIMDDHLVM